MTLLCTCSRPAQTAPISRRTDSGSTAISSIRLPPNKAWREPRHRTAMVSPSNGAGWRKSRHRSERLAQAARINRGVLGCRPLAAIALALMPLPQDLLVGGAKRFQTDAHARGLSAKAQSAAIPDRPDRRRRPARAEAAAI